MAAARLTRAAGRAAGSGGSTLPGLVAERLRPGILSELGGALPDGCVFVTGTNGKTTTCRFLVGMLEAAGKRVVANSDGSNLSRGIAGALVRASDTESGLPSADIGVFEVDEGALPEVAKKLPPRMLVVLDLFRDQLDRYGEVDTLARRIGEVAASLTDARVVLNADDPLVAGLAEDAAWFGVNDASAASRASARAADAVHCPTCGGPLAFDVRYYAHLGHWRCTRCGHGRPEPAASLTNVRLDVQGSVARLTTRSGPASIRLAVPGLYNLYNALAASTAAVELGIDPGLAVEVLGGTRAAFGRMERAQVRGHEMLLLLVKNPTGFTQAAETLARDGRPKHLLLALNDNLADGTDTSWVWDAEVELLRDVAARVVTTGTRAEEMALRCKYAGIDGSRVVVEPDLTEGVISGLDALPLGETLHALPTYTAMTGIRAALAKGGWVREKLA